MKRLYVLALSALTVLSAALVQQPLSANAQAISAYPLASPAPADVLLGDHGGVLGVGGTTSKFLVSGLGPAVGPYLVNVPWAALPYVPVQTVGGGTNISCVGTYSVLCGTFPNITITGTYTSSAANPIALTYTGTPVITSATTGTSSALAINATGGTTGDLLDVQLGGATEASITNSGAVNTVSTYNVAGAPVLSTIWATNNLFVGYSAGSASDTGVQNTGVGNSALNVVLSGSNNTAFGYTACAYLATGSLNTCLGGLAGRYITGGSTQNTASASSTYVGYSTKASADGDTNETVIGYNVTGNGSNTTTIGNASVTNTNFGGGVLSIGGNNVLSATWGTTSLFVGYTAGNPSTTATGNVGVGNGAMNALTSSNNNTGIGANACGNLQSGAGANLCLGLAAGRFITGGSTPMTTGTTSTFVGASTKASADGDTNENVIGYNVTGNGSNTTTIGNSSITASYFPSPVLAASTAGGTKSYEPMVYTNGGAATSSTEHLMRYSCVFAASTTCAVTLTGASTGQFASATSYACASPDMGTATTYVGYTIGNKTATGFTVYASASNSNTVYGLCSGT
ncbi:MAG: hypothetical protein WCE44_02605 [Candidatus Velthaea sp.]